MLKMGQVVIQEVDRTNWLSRTVASCTHSQVTHAWIATRRGYGVEAWFPQVRIIPVKERLAELRAKDRAFAILDLPSIGQVERAAIVDKAESYIGRWYDVGQILLFLLTGEFWDDGAGTLICSRLVTASYFSGAQENLFPDALLATEFPVTFPRLDNLRAGYVVPSDLLRSRLEVVDFRPSSHIHTVDDFLKV